jgi:hypothetical protein
MKSERLKLLDPTGVVKVKVHRVLESRVRDPKTCRGAKMADPEVLYI